VRSRWGKAYFMLTTWMPPFLVFSLAREMSLPS
jgi:hypothetical protein